MGSQAETLTITTVKRNDMKERLLLVFIFFVLGFIACSTTDPPADLTGAVKFQIGTSRVERDGAHIAINNGMKIREGDIIRTGKSSVVIIAFGDIADVEIQSESTFQISDLKRNGTIELTKGNAWFQVKKKLKKLNAFILKTPTSVAAVRGTKMYAFQAGDMFGTCHCEGDVEFASSDGTYKNIHHGDFLTFASAKGTVVLLPDELRALGMKELKHDHSEIHGSPLGNKMTVMPPSIQNKLMALVWKKMRNYK